jgi:hypothetical protein
MSGRIGENIMLLLPKRGFSKRMRIYLKEMYPVPPRLLASALLYFSFTAFLQTIHGTKTQIFSAQAFIGIWSLFAILLILRLMDELKDREIDGQLFAQRPLPSGKVVESDIRFSLILVAVLFLAANILAGAAFWMALFVLGYSLLMFVRFLAPRALQGSLLLTLTTHNPIIPIMLFYLVILFSAEQNLPLRNLKWNYVLPLILIYWAVSFAWEIARKIRSPEEENSYVTYSQIFGRVWSVALAGTAQTIALAVGLYLWVTLSLSWIFIAILTAGYVLAMWGHGRFIFRPDPTTSKLRAFAECYIVTLCVARIIDYAILS